MTNWPSSEELWGPDYAELYDACKQPCPLVKLLDFSTKFPTKHRLHANNSAMLTMEIIYALLQGLPAKYLDFLEPPWPPFCLRLEQALKNGATPVEALSYAIESMNDWGRSQLNKTLLEVRPVMNLPGLSYRQKEALITLRSVDVASLAQLSRVLLQDPSNVRKRLLALVKKGYILRFFRQGGIHYYAIPQKMEKSIKHSVNDLMNSLIAKAASEKSPQQPDLPK